MAIVPSALTQAEKDKQLIDALARVAKGSATPVYSRTQMPYGGGTPRALGSYTSRLGDMQNVSDAELERAQLDKALLNAESRVTADATSAGNIDEIIAGLRQIAQGEKAPGGFSLGNLIKGTLGKVAQGATYIMGRPLAVVTSVGKELSDIPSGKASFGDFIKQSFAKDTTPSKYLPKTGTKWLDQTLGFVADVVLDPLTYINFGASQWAGREGRLNLAAWAAKEENIAKAPTILAKIEDGSIGRLGEWAFSRKEVRDLGMQRGISWAFGNKGIIGKEGTALAKLSEGLATGIGKPLAHTRAFLGDLGVFTPLQKLTAKEAEKVAGLTWYGRRAMDSAEVMDGLTKLAAYNSAIKGNAAGRLIGSKLSKEGSSLVNDLIKYESAGVKVHDLLEGLRAPVNDAEAALAERTRNFLDYALNAQNEPTAAFGVKRGTSPYLVAKRQNYVPHFLTDAFKEKLASKEFQNSSVVTSLRRSLGIGKNELISGPSTLRERTLKTGDKFLGKVLKTDTGDGFAAISEINDIAEKRLKVKLFEDDAATYISGYIANAVNQAKRVAFADSLFDYGPDVVQRIVPKIVDNKIVGEKFKKTLNLYDNVVTPILDELSKTTEGVLGPRLALAQAVISSEPGAKILTETQLDGVRKVLQATMDNLDATDNVVAGLDAETRAAYNVVARPLKARLNTINDAIATGDEIKLVKELGLNDLYRRLYPNAVSVPEAKAAAEDIVDGLEHLLGNNYSEPALKSLENALTGAEQNLAGSTTSAVNRLKSQLETLQTTEPNAVNKIASTQKKLDFATNQLDVEKTVALPKSEWDQTVGKVYGDDINKILEEVTVNPPKGPAGEVTARWVDQAVRTLKQLEAPGLALNPQEREVISNVFTQLKGMEAQIALLEAQRAIPEKVLEGTFNAKTVSSLAKKTLDGWENIESLGVKMSPEMRDQLFGRVGELMKPKSAVEFMKMYKAYTKFFKVSAMFSPGFIARNGYTAAFNNFVHGVNIQDVYNGTKFATNVMRLGVDEALTRVPQKLRPLYEEALKVAYAGGAGQAVDDILAPILSGKANKILQGKILGKWAKTNEGLELAARYSMALSDLRKGLSFESAVGNIARYHFDYTNLSSLDKALTSSGVIPFWIFASRNVPLQLVNQIARPKMFRMWEAAQRNFPAVDQENMPGYLRERGMLQLPFMPKGMLFNPDLPHLDMQDQIRMFSDPMRLLSQANPLVKLPIELMGSRTLWNAVPFSEKNATVRGPLDYPAFIAGLLSGGAGRNPETGQFYTSSKMQYAVPNLLPTLAQLQRLFPSAGGKEAYQDRAGSSRYSFFGLPFRTVSQDEQFNELQRRQFAIRDYLSNLSKRGVIQSKNTQ